MSLAWGGGASNWGNRERMNAAESAVSKAYDLVSEDMSKLQADLAKVVHVCACACACMIDRYRER